jgi:uncharacterized protein
MEKPIRLQKVLQFFVIKIIIGIAVVAGSVVLVEWAGRWLLDHTAISFAVKDLLIALGDATAALCSYLLLFSRYEKRRITELSVAGLGKNAFLGTSTGLLLQSLFILIIYIAGGYSVTSIHSVSSLLPAFSAALTAGFVAEIIIIGVVFRVLEQQWRTSIALVVMALLFAFMHRNAPGATILSICSTAVQAGILLSALFVFTRKLWASIFMHFAWDFAEPGIFGGINPGNAIEHSLFSSKISGPWWLTGALSGPQNSIQSLLLCSLTAILFLYLAKRNNNFIRL